MNPKETETQVKKTTKKKNLKIIIDSGKEFTKYPKEIKFKF